MLHTFISCFASNLDFGDDHPSVAQHPCIETFDTKGQSPESVLIPSGWTLYSPSIHVLTIGLTMCQNKIINHLTGVTREVLNTQHQLFLSVTLSSDLLFGCSEVCLTGVLITQSRNQSTNQSNSQSFFAVQYQFWGVIFGLL